MAISKKTERFMTQASWIRKMFEEGLRLRQEPNAAPVYDFTLGNPIFEPPAVVQHALRQAVLNPTPGMHRYMPNAGYPECRERVGDYLRRELGVPITGEDVVMTGGAAGAMNVALKSLIDPGDEVVVIAPYFPEYFFYIDSVGGTITVAESSADFDLDLAAIERAVGKRTRALILNSPNNPTGRLYSAARLQELGELLAQKERLAGGPITILSDEPYRKIVFDGRTAPSVMAIHPNTILINSHSKDLGLPGERIGYAAISPSHRDRLDLRNALTFNNRALGFVNAPALFQRVVAETQEAQVDVQQYQKLRDQFCRGLSQAGLRCVQPEGAFYLFPQTPTPDDMACVRALQRYRVLAVPGSGFGRAGHIRLIFCVTPEEIDGALPGIKQAVADSKTLER
jgi:aspartate aminotransferase